MKKTISLLLAALMVMCCAASYAEGTKVQNNDGPFPVSYELKEGFELVSDEWTEYLGSKMYQARIKNSDGLSFYFSISAPLPDETEADEDVSTEPVTFNEANGYTDEVLKTMVKEMYRDEYDSFDVGVQTTAYGTKLVVIRFNDVEAPSTYVYTVYKDYEVGLTMVSEDAEGNKKQITDDQVQKMVDFVSELWMGAEAMNNN